MREHTSNRIPAAVSATLAVAALLLAGSCTEVAGPPGNPGMNAAYPGQAAQQQYQQPQSHPIRDLFASTIAAVLQTTSMGIASGISGGIVNWFAAKTAQKANQGYAGAGNIRIPVTDIPTRPERIRHIRRPRARIRARTRARLTQARAIRVRATQTPRIRTPPIRIQTALIHRRAATRTAAPSTRVPAIRRRARIPTTAVIPTPHPNIQVQAIQTALRKRPTRDIRPRARTRIRAIRQRERIPTTAGIPTTHPNIQVRAIQTAPRKRQTRAIQPRARTRIRTIRRRVSIRTRATPQPLSIRTRTIHRAEHPGRPRLTAEWLRRATAVSTPASRTKCTRCRRTGIGYRSIR